MEAASAAINGGISLLEIVCSTPGVFEVVKELVRLNPSSFIGVGTVLNLKDAQKAIESGAKFLMSPAFVEDILDDLKGSETLYLPGVMTPTEVLNAYEAGACMVKVYPISLLGGPHYISTLKRPFPHIPIVASQGIKLDSVGLYIKHGASAVVLSDAIFEKDAMMTKDFHSIHKLASKAVSEGRKAIKQSIHS